MFQIFAESLEKEAQTHSELATEILNITKYDPEDNIIQDVSRTY